MGLTNEQLPRRDFLKAGGAGVLALIFWGLGVPIGHKDEKFEGILKPGWIEKLLPNRVDFFTLENQGNRKFVEYVCDQTPHLRAILAKVYNEFLYGQITDSAPTLGGIFERHIELAQAELEQRYGVEPPLSEVAHTAMYTLAHFLYPHLEEDKNGIFARRTQIFGVPLPSKRADKQALFRQSYLTKLPFILPVEESGDHSPDYTLFKLVGWDRLIHFVQHAFVYHMYTYSQYSGTDDWRHMHNWMRAITPTILSNDERTQILLDAITYVWEGYETLTDITKRARAWRTGEEVIPNGFLDQYWKMDAFANGLGAKVGKFLANQNLSWQDLELVYAKLDDPALTTLITDMEEQLPEIEEEFATPFNN